MTQASEAAEATERPWEVRRRVTAMTGGRFVIRRQGDSLSEATFICEIPWAATTGQGEREQNANAALIVTAVNERDSLLAQVEELKAALRGLVDSLSDQDDEGLIEHAEQMQRARVVLKGGR